MAFVAACGSAPAAPAAAALPRRHRSRRRGGPATAARLAARARPLGGARAQPLAGRASPAARVAGACGGPATAAARSPNGAWGRKARWPGAVPAARQARPYQRPPRWCAGAWPRRCAGTSAAALSCARQQRRERLVPGAGAATPAPAAHSTVPRRATRLPTWRRGSMARINGSTQAHPRGLVEDTNLAAMAAVLVVPAWGTCMWAQQHSSTQPRRECATTTRHMMEQFWF
jgi:hypothetical protein